MDYEKAYKEALEWMRKIYPTLTGTNKEDAEHYFQELNESEDERIRKDLITFICQFAPEHLKVQYVAYLDRQKDKRELDFAEGKVDGAKQTCQEIKDAMSLFEPKDLTPFEFTFRDYIDSAIRYCVSGEGYQQYIKEWAADLLNLERQKEHKLPEPEYGGENKQYPTEYRLDQDTRKKLIALVEKFGQEEDKEEMLDYLEKYQPVQSASEVKEFNFQPGDPDEKAIERLKAMIYFAFDETSEVPMDEACALDDWLDEKCKPVEWSKGKIPKDIEKDAVQFCFDKGLNVTPYQAKQIASHYLRIGHNEGYVEGRKNAHIPAKDLGLPGSMDYKHEWNEEDEEMIARICANLEYLMKEAGCDSKFKETLEERIKWMKRLSLRFRPQPHWKPSEYTLSLVKKVANGEMLTHMEQMAMETLCNDLQKRL